MDYKLELVLIPVSDVDRAKKFYLEQAGFVLIVDTPIGEDMRVVQAVPPGSACAIGFGTGLTSAAPGAAQGLHLVVPDILAARAELVERGEHPVAVHVKLTPVAFGQRGERGLITRDRRAHDLLGAYRLVSPIHARPCSGRLPAGSRCCRPGR